ncbi:MAG TPA: class II glutamine amidotransferase, partial [Dongiaceae bacterium]
MLTTHPFDDDHLKEECGIVGIYGVEDVAAHTVLGLHALQHRGQEAAGIVTFDGQRFHAHRELGHVADSFGKQSVVEQLRGHASIGHVRYSTTGDTILRNVQPLFAELAFGGFAVGHNGNLTNAHAVRRELVKRGSLFQSTTDTEVIQHLMATHLRGNVVDRLIHALHQVEGAYSLVALANDMVIGVRDPLGVRPLVLGKLGTGYILASETCALDIVGADFIRDVEAGEIVVLDRNGVTSIKPFSQVAQRFCVFEYIYFARPDSV